MASQDLSAITMWITKAAIEHPEELAKEIEARVGLVRPQSHRIIRKLIQLNWLINSGTPRKPFHKPGLLRQVVQHYQLLGLQEDLPWANDFAPYFSLSKELERIAQHAFTELLNNAIDHSEGSTVVVSLRQTPSHLQLLVSDNGRGLFDKIKHSFAIQDPQAAMLEISKGKLTSQPQRHTGRGLFFTSKLADVFDLHANTVSFQHREWSQSGWHPGRALKHTGTSIYFAIALDTPRTLESVLRSYSSNGDGFGFDRTVVPLRLVSQGSSPLESRAQARRVANRLGQFQRAEVDFTGIEFVGHSFADELFRVFASQHSQTQLIPINMSPPVAAMVASVLAY